MSVKKQTASRRFTPAEKFRFQSPLLIQRQNQFARFLQRLAAGCLIFHAAQRLRNNRFENKIC